MENETDAPSKEPCDLCGELVEKTDRGAFRSDVVFCARCSDGFAT